MSMKTERERQAERAPLNKYIITSTPSFETTVVCSAATEAGAFRIACADHPGVLWDSIQQLPHAS